MNIEAMNFFKGIYNGTISLQVKDKCPEYLKSLYKNPRKFIEYHQEWLNIFNIIKEQHSNEIDHEKKGILKKRIEEMLIFILQGTLTFLRSYKEFDVYDEATRKLIVKSNDRLNRELLKGSKIYSEINDKSFLNKGPRSTRTYTFVEERDSLDLAQDLISNPQVKRIAVLSMAAKNFPCGGVEKGHWAQVK